MGAVRTPLRAVLPSRTLRLESRPAVAAVPRWKLLLHPVADIRPPALHRAVSRYPPLAVGHRRAAAHALLRCLPGSKRPPALDRAGERLLPPLHALLVFVSGSRVLLSAGVADQSHGRFRFAALHVAVHVRMGNRIPAGAARISRESRETVPASQAAKDPWRTPPVAFRELGRVSHHRSPALVTRQGQESLAAGGEDLLERGPLREHSLSRGRRIDGREYIGSTVR